MILGWIGALVLLLVIFPVVVILLRGVLMAARSIPPTVEAIAGVAEMASRDLDGVELLHKTRAAVHTTVGVVADYGGSLDIVLEDA